MAILDSLKSKKSVPEVSTEKGVTEKEVQSGGKKTDTFSLHRVIKSPRITEKAAILSGDRVYTFEIDLRATKIDVARAIKELYKVEPIRVATSILPAKRKIVRGKRGTTSKVKKALVYLKEGDTIDFV